MGKITVSVYDQFSSSRGKKMLDMSSLMLESNSDSSNLIIGLGTLGCEAALEVKAMMRKHFRNSGDWVRILAIDNDEAALAYMKSSAELGSVSLDSHEKLILRLSNVAALQLRPEYTDWLDSRLLCSGYSRQMSRLLLMENYAHVGNRIIHKIFDMLRRYTATTGVNKQKVNIFILAGLAGCTGSALAIDVPYIARELMQRNNIHGDIYGYLFMPDVMYEVARGCNDLFNRNAYAALKELDYNLLLQQKGESYTIRYPGGYRIEPGKDIGRIYDYVCFFSATGANGAVIADARRNAIRTAAQGISAMIEPAVVSDSLTAQGLMANMNHMNYMFRMEHPEISFCSDYIALGASSFELPMDDVMMYTAASMFEKSEDLLSRIPREREFAQFADAIGLSMASMVEGFKAAIPQLIVHQPDRAAFRHGDYVNYLAKANAVYAAKDNPEMMTQLDNAAANIAKGICKRFDDQMSLCFKDRTRGPVFADRLIVDAELGMLRNIFEQRQSLAYPENAAPEVLFQNQIRAFSNAKQKLERFMGKSTENCANYNNTGMALYESCLRYVLSDSLLKIYDMVEKHIRCMQKDMYEPAAEALPGMSEVFRENQQLLLAPHTPDGLKPLSIARIHGILDEALERAFSEQQRGVTEIFLHEYYRYMELRRDGNRSDNFHVFVSKFVCDRFGWMAGMTFEEVIGRMLDSKGKDLRDWVRNEFLPQLIRGAEPMIFEKAGMPKGKKFLQISVPECCPRLYTIIQEELPEALVYAGLDTVGAGVQKSCDRNRVSARTYQCNVSPANYEIIWRAEQDYAKHRELTGLHLVDPHGDHVPADAVSWRNLPALIPMRYSGAEIHPESQAILNAGHEGEVRGAVTSEGGVPDEAPSCGQSDSPNPWESF